MLRGAPYLRGLKPSCARRGLQVAALEAGLLDERRGLAARRGPRGSMTLDRARGGRVGRRARRARRRSSSPSCRRYVPGLEVRAGEARAEREDERRVDDARSRRAGRRPRRVEFGGIADRHLLAALALERLEERVDAEREQASSTRTRNARIRPRRRRRFVNAGVAGRRRRRRQRAARARRGAAPAARRLVAVARRCARAGRPEGRSAAAPPPAGSLGDRRLLGAGRRRRLRSTRGRLRLGAASAPRPRPARRRRLAPAARLGSTGGRVGGRLVRRGCAASVSGSNGGGRLERRRPRGSRLGRRTRRGRRRSRRGPSATSRSDGVLRSSGAKSARRAGSRPGSSSCRSSTSQSACAPSPCSARARCSGSSSDGLEVVGSGRPARRAAGQRDSPRAARRRLAFGARALALLGGVRSRGASSCRRKIGIQTRRQQANDRVRSVRRSEACGVRVRRRGRAGRPGSGGRSSGRVSACTSARRGSTGSSLPSGPRSHLQLRPRPGACRVHELARDRCAGGAP